MKILINANCSVGGGLQVCDSLIRTLGEFPHHSFTVCATTKVLESLKNFTPPSNVKLLLSPRQSPLMRILGKNPAMDEIVSKNGIDAVFTVFGPSYWKPAIPHLCGYAKPHYVYPESVFFKKLRIKEKLRYAAKKRIHLKSFLKDANALVTENPDVSERLKQLYGCKHVYTVYNTFNPVFKMPSLWDDSLKLPEFDGTTILTVSSYYPHKNLEIMVPSARFLTEKYPDFKFRFVLSLQHNQFPADITGLEKHFVFLGKVSVSQCPYLYQQSQIMFLPTLLECFSATWAEAMFMQVPILTSDLLFARGICGNAAMYVDPLSPEKIAESIYKLASSADLRENLIKNGNETLPKFTDSKHRMESYLSILEKLVQPNESSL